MLKGKESYAYWKEFSEVEPESQVFDNADRNQTAEIARQYAMFIPINNIDGDLLVTNRIYEEVDVKTSAVALLSSSFTYAVFHQLIKWASDIRYIQQAPLNTNEKVKKTMRPWSEVANRKC